MFLDNGCQICVVSMQDRGCWCRTLLPVHRSHDNGLLSHFGNIPLHSVTMLPSADFLKKLWFLILENCVENTKGLYGDVQTLDFIDS